MAETDDLLGPLDSGRYDNDFEKLPHDEELVSSTTESPVSSGAADGDTAAEKDPGSGAQESGHAAGSKSQLNVEELLTERETQSRSDVVADDVPTCSMCCVKNIDPRVKDLVLWRDVKKSGIVFGSSLTVLLALATCSVISVISYLALATLAMTASFRSYHYCMAAVRKTEATNPFSKYLEMDLTIPEDQARHCAGIVAKHVSAVAGDFRRLIFIDSAIDTLKCALVLWVLTYIGGWFNGLTLLIIGDICLFTLPKVYETYQKQIDDGLKTVCVKAREVWKQAEAKVPMLSKLKQA